MDFPTEEPTPEQKQAALIQALRARLGAGQQQQQGLPTEAGFDQAWGNAGLMTGDKVLANFGQSQIQQGQHINALADSAQQRTLAQALEAQRMASNEQHQRAQEDIARRQLDASKFGSGPNGIYNLRTGEVVRDPAPKGGAGGAGSTAQQNKWMEEFSKAIGKNSIRTTLGKLEQGLIRTDELESLVRDQTGKIIDLNPQNVHEAAGMYAQLLAQGNQPALEQIKNLTPVTKQGELANWLQQWSGKIVPAGQIDFLEQMMAGAARAKKVANDKIRELQLNAIPTYLRHRREGDQTRKDIDAKLKANGLNPDAFDDEGLPIPGVSIDFAMPSAAPVAGIGGPSKMTRAERDARIAEIQRAAALAGQAAK